MPNLDTDLDSLADEGATSTGSNPLKDAIANFGRDDEAESPQDDTAEEQVESEEASEESEEVSEDVSEEEGEEPTEDAEETEDEEADKPEGKQAKLASLDIPMPNADGTKGPRGTGKIKVEGLPQEAADAMRHYIKAAERLPLIEEQLNVAQDAALIADFVEHDPVSAMVMIASARPDATEEFVRSYLAMNPAKIAQFTTELELEDMTEREVKLMSKEAKRSAEDKAKASFQGHAATNATQRQADKLLVTVQSLATAANLDGDDLEEFMFVASRRVAKLFQQNPKLTNRDVVANLQPVVAKYAKTVTPPAPKGKQGTPAKTFAAKVTKSQKFSVVGSGKAAIKPAGAVTRPKKGTTVSEAIRMIRAGKI